MSAVTLSLKILILTSLSRFLNFKCRFRADFQARVYAALLEVPAGRVITYGDLASHRLPVAACRGRALRRNPFAPVVPCHRATVAAGRLGGFRAPDGAALSRKRALLAAEEVLFPQWPAGGTATPVALSWWVCQNRPIPITPKVIVTKPPVPPGVRTRDLRIRNPLCPAELPGFWFGWSL